MATPDMDMCRELHAALQKNKPLYALMERAKGFPFPYYFGAGCIVQTVWNLQTGRDPMQGIEDIDFVYFDPDTTYEAEDAVIRSLMQRFAPTPVKLDIKNQARVHIWYAEHFGKPVAPYLSLEDAIRTWPTTASAVGVRLNGEQLEVFAPFGLHDLFGQVVRANKARITKEIYQKKVAKWTAKWPSLTVIPWEESPHFIIACHEP